VGCFFQQPTDTLFGVQSKQATHRLRVRAKNLRDAAKEDLAADKDYLIAARFGMDTGAFSDASRT